MQKSQKHLLFAFKPCSPGGLRYSPSAGVHKHFAFLTTIDFILQTVAMTVQVFLGCNNPHCHVLLFPHNRINNFVD